LANLSVWFEGMGVGIALAAPIGPINIEIIRRGLAGGFLHGWLVGVGALTADTVYCALVVSGFAHVADTPLLRAPLLLLGAIVLLYLGAAALRAPAAVSSADAAPSSRGSYLVGLAMAAANPFGIIYWLSIGAALIASVVRQSGAGAAPAVVVGVFSGIMVWVTLLASATRLGRSFVSARSLRVLTGAAAVALIAFGLYFGFEGIRELTKLSI
jgi:L-lysine exporter family protein LysE/ArgO